ncbi:hypothetical protein C8R44DRAFT_741178 [Mycena epipterygia]|nr:hypothetical protein C8R44DRAFT_741178 [Mycena epipterygia]
MDIWRVCDVVALALSAKIFISFMSVAIHTSSRAAACSVADFRPQQQHGYYMALFLPSKTAVNRLTDGRAKNCLGGIFNHWFCHRFYNTLFAAPEHSGINLACIWWLWVQFGDNPGA